jgi:HEAT repeat protein
MVKISKVLRQLKDGDYYVKKAALKRLGEFKDERAVSALIGIIMEKSRYSSVVEFEKPKVLKRYPLDCDFPEDFLDTAMESLLRIGSHAIPLLFERYMEMDSYAQERSEYIMSRVMDECGDFKNLHVFEKHLEQGLERIKKRKKQNADQARAQSLIAKLRIVLEDRKNKLASGRDLLLHEKPKPPKKSRMYQQLRRQRNG